MGQSQHKPVRQSQSLPPQNFPSGRSSRHVSEPGRRNTLPSKRPRAPPLDNASRRRSYCLPSHSDASPSHSDLPITAVYFLPEYPVLRKEDVKEFEVQEVIAKGAFGNVLRVVRAKDGLIYAMKVMKKNRVMLEGAVQQCKDEADIQNCVGHHPFIVKPFWFFQNDADVHIVMEYVPRGELFALWKRHEKFPEQLVCVYLAELAMVLDYLHKCDIIYRDLKMENILIDAQGHLQVIDFGLAKWLKKGLRTKTICGTLQYIAPEVLSPKPYGHAADWWSLGILGYTLLVGNYPVRGARNHAEMSERMRNSASYQLPTNHGFSWPARDVIRMLLQRDANVRIHELKTLKKHPFFSYLDFDRLYNRQISPRLLLEGEIDDQSNCLDRSLSYGIDNLKRISKKPKRNPTPSSVIPPPANSVEDASLSASQTSSEPKIHLNEESFGSSTDDSNPGRHNQSYVEAISNADSLSPEFPNFDRTFLKYRSLITPYQYPGLMDNSPLRTCKPLRYSLLPPMRRAKCGGSAHSLQCARSDEVLSCSWDDPSPHEASAGSRGRSASVNDILRDRTELSDASGVISWNISTRGESLV